MHYRFYYAQIPEGEGGLLNKVLYGVAKIAPLSYTSRISQNNRISFYRHVFAGFSVILIQLRVISARLWHPLTYFALAIISSTLQLIF